MLPLFNVSLKKHKNPLNLELLNACAFMNCCRVSQQTVQHLNIKEVYNLFLKPLFACTTTTAFEHTEQKG